MWPNSDRCCSCRTTTIAASLVAMLLTIGEVQNLKCRAPDHWRRRGEFVDIAEQCSNTTAGDRFTTAAGISGQDNDYSSGSDSDRRSGHRRNAENSWVNDDSRRNGDGRKQNNREFSVMRQDFGGNSNHDGYNGSGDNRGNGGNRGHSSDNRGNGGNRGGYGGGGGYGSSGSYNSGGDHDSPTSCDVRQPQQLQYYPPGGNNGDRQKNYPQGNSYYPSVDYDARQSNFNNRQSSTRRYRRNTVNENNNSNNNHRSKAVSVTGSHRILGNNRFRNVTKNGGSSAKGSILDKMDACTIHCVFNQLEMLNSNSRPDKTSIVNIMTNQIKDVELKEFIQDSIDECFDTLELDSHNSKCDFSKNFAMCMENKAQRNCDDWDENVSANKNYAQDEGNNQQDKRKGY